MAIRNSVFHIYNVTKEFIVSEKVNNCVNEVAYRRGEIYTAKQVNGNVKQLEEAGFIKFKQKLVW